MIPYFNSEEKTPQSFNTDEDLQRYKHVNRLTLLSPPDYNAQQYVLGEPLFLKEDLPQYNQQTETEKQQKTKQPVKQFAKEQKRECSDSVTTETTRNMSENGDQDKTQVVHKILENDSLQGLSLIYDVSVHSIKKRNNLTSDDIYFLKSVIIPDPKLKPALTEQDREEIKIKDFMGYLERDDRSHKTARYYLGENDWDVAQAVKEYKEDVKWQRQNKHLLFKKEEVINTPNGMRVQGIQYKNDNFKGKNMKKQPRDYYAMKDMEMMEMDKYHKYF